MGDRVLKVLKQPESISNQSSNGSALPDNTVQSVSSLPEPDGNLVAFPVPDETKRAVDAECARILKNITSNY